jgi:coenzyme Q-binding protein COQ10
LRHRLTRVLPYSPEQLFDLVGDVERYPQFVRWVTGIRVWNRRTTVEGVVRLDAEAEVRFSIIRECFATQVSLDRSRLAVDVDLISGPFRRLKNSWRFAPHAAGAEITFAIDFEFGSRFLEAILAANFSRAVDRLIGCFETRARDLYGPNSGSSTVAAP